MFDPIYQAIAWLLALFYSFIPNLGVAIILLTFAIMLLLYPLTAKQAKSMIAMQRAQPEIKKLQAKYKGDREKLNEETMKFYRENKINPLAGCLPLLVQMPIFFALFRTLREPYKYVPKDSSLYHALCDGANCAKGVVNHLTFLGTDLQKSAVDAHDGLLSAVPYFILVGLVILTGFLQTRQAQKRTPVANKQMGTVMRVLPIFFGLISLQFPAGLVLYFFVSNLWRLGQQEIIFRRFGSALTPAKTEGKALPGGKKAAVIDVESRDAQDRPPVEDVPKAQPRVAAAKPKPKAEVEPGSGDSRAAPRSSRRGLRGLFDLPPPPTSNGGGTPTTRSASGTSSTGGSGGSPRPQQARARSNKKKRKR